jgi:hypothetical protein
MKGDKFYKTALKEALKKDANIVYRTGLRRKRVIRFYIN